MYTKNSAIIVTMKNSLAIIVITLCLLSTSSRNALADQDNKLLEKARQEYKRGNLDKALNLLIEDLKKNPDDGTTHYYLGLVRKQMGEDLPALQELELAARLLPADTLSAYTKQAVNQIQASEQKLPEKPKPKEWFEVLGDSVSQLFNGQKENRQGKELEPWQMPDLMAGVDDIYRQAKRMVRSQDKKHGRHSGYQSWAAKTMSMADIQDLVRKSKYINPDSWASHKDGVKSLRQAPANTQEWDFWIARYKRAFQYILMSHLAKEGEVRPYGSSACIFSIDKDGNLRGHIYASTASAKLNKCLIKTIQELNHSRILQFPKNAKITGYNFQMKWHFGKLLRYIAYVRAIKKQQLELAQRAAEAKLLAAQQEARAKLLEKKTKNKERLIAKQKRLALLKKKREEEALAYTRKADVSAIVLPKPKPLELKARQLTLADVPYSETLDTMEGDPFSQIDDRTIMNWPDVNR